MTRINFKKLATKKELLAVIKRLVNAMNTSICIEDADGKILIGLGSDIATNKYPVELSGEVMGWVRGTEKASVIASLLSYLVKQEYEKKLLANELLEKYQEIDLLQDISTQITASLNLQEVARLVIEEAGELIQSTHGSILLLDQETGYFKTLSEFGHASLPKEPQRLGQGIIGTIVQTGSGEIVNDVSTDPRFVNCHEPIRSLICVPLKTKEQLIGAITVSSERPVTYCAGDLKLLTMLALQAAVAIEKALLYEQSRAAVVVAQAHTQQLQHTLDELQQTQAQLIQSEKMSGLGQLVAGVAHEINNPVNFIYGNLNHASQYIEDLLQLLDLYAQHYPQPVPEIQAEAEAIDLEFLIEDLPKLVSSMELGVDRIRAIVLSLRNFSRLQEAQRQAVNIHEGIDSTLLILQHRLKTTTGRSTIQVIKEYGQLPLVECYASQLNQVFMNLLSNAIDALEESLTAEQNYSEDPSQRTPANANSHLFSTCCESDTFANTAIPFTSVQWSVVKDLKRVIDTPTIWIRTEVLSSGYVLIRIRDNGSGMTEEVRSQLFQPFFTTKPMGKGTGLGLSISHQIVVEKHGGILTCFSQPGEGTEFRIQIPVAPLSATQLNQDIPATILFTQGK